MPESRRTIHFAFNLGDLVTLVDINRPGIINGLLANTDSLTYRVTYWHDGQRRSEWVTGGEIKLREPNAS